MKTHNDLADKNKVHKNNSSAGLVNRFFLYGSAEVTALDRAIQPWINGRRTYSARILRPPGVTKKQKHEKQNFLFIFMVCACFGSVL